MSISPEKNDVNIRRLFDWGKPFDILDGSSQVIFSYFHRLCTDEEVNRARVFALRKSAEIRKKLRTEDSDERVAFITPSEGLSKEQLIEMVLVYRARALVLDTYSSVNIPFPKQPPSGASLEEQEEYQISIDEYPIKRETAIRQKVEENLITEREKLSKMSEEQLYKMYEDSVIDDICQKEMVGKYRDMCLFFGAFSDARYKKPLFESIEEVYRLPEGIKSQFVENSLSLDIDLEDLKK